MFKGQFLRVIDIFRQQNFVFSFWQHKSLKNVKVSNNDAIWAAEYCSIFLFLQKTVMEKEVES